MRKVITLQEIAAKKEAYLNCCSESSKKYIVEEIDALKAAVKRIEHLLSEQHKAAKRIEDMNALILSMIESDKAILAAALKAVQIQQKSHSHH